jgi:hypothetical protein
MMLQVNQKHSWQCFEYIMETCGMIWNAYNEDRLFKNIH